MVPARSRAFLDGPAFRSRAWLVVPAHSRTWLVVPARSRAFLDVPAFRSRACLNCLLAAGLDLRCLLAAGLALWCLLAAGLSLACLLFAAGLSSRCLLAAGLDLWCLLAAGLSFDMPTRRRSFLVCSQQDSTWQCLLFEAGLFLSLHA